MAITVREAMQIGGLARCTAAAGKDGLDRIIDSVAVMEVPDVVRWLQKNVLLLTSLYPIKDDEEAIHSLAEQLDAIGCAALAVKTGQYANAIPAPILEAGDRLGLPIIEIAPEVSYLDIMTPLMTAILQRKEGGERLEAFSQWMKELALGGSGIPALARALEHMIGNRVTIGSDLPELELTQGLEAAPLTRAQNRELKAAKRPLRMQRMLEGRLTDCIVTPLLLHDELLGEMTCWVTARALVESDVRMLDRMMLYMALECYKVLTRAEQQYMLRNDILTELLTSEWTGGGETLRKAERLGLHLRGSFDVLCVVMQERHGSAEENASGVGHEEAWSPERRRKAIRRAEEAVLRRSSRKPEIAFVQHEMVLLIPQPEAGTEQAGPDARGAGKQRRMDIAQALRASLTDEFEAQRCVVGIGRSYEGLEGIRQGYQEAVKAVRLGSKSQAEEGCVYYGDLGVYRLLHPLYHEEELKRLYEETIGPLVQYDRMHSGRLAETLSEFFACNGSLADTAEKLYIHVNTIKYRLDKIAQLTGCRVHDAEERLLLHMGLKIYHYLQSE